MQAAVSVTVIKSLLRNKVIFLTFLISNSYILYIDLLKTGIFSFKQRNSVFLYYLCTDILKLIDLKMFEELGVWE